MGRLGRYRIRALSGRSVLAALLLLLPLLAGCSDSTDTASGSDSAGSSDRQSSVETTDEAVETTDEPADGTDAGSACAGVDQERIGTILDLTPAGAPESIDEGSDPLVLIGAPRGLVSFTGCSLPFTGAGLDPDQELTADVYFTDGGHDDFERIRSSVTSQATPVLDLGDEAFTAMTLQTLVIARKGSKIVVVGYLVQNEENTIEVAREVLAGL
jgi:hypothetical protein